VALIVDGITALIGADNNTTGPAAAYVFTRSGSTFAQQAKLSPGTAPVAGDLFVRSVALSTDGNTALVGDHNFGVVSPGSAYVFTRSGTTWTQQQRLTASDGAAGDDFGLGMSLSGDGNTAAIDGVGHNGGKGVSYVFTRSGGVWTQQAELTASDGVNGDFFGFASISGDGSTLLIGAVAKNSGEGAAYIFTGSGPTWTQQQELTASDGLPGDGHNFGIGGALSANASTALIGAPAIFNPAASGAAYVFLLMPTSIDQCKKDGWQSFGVFKNQGDCVSFFATQGKNPPG
jgi:hypothetical protein